MGDNKPNKSLEFIDETKPERDSRSLFEKLMDKETEEEKLRKKLDKELKEAARKRAEQSEEEQRLEEKREVAETRKLKKKWRARLVEKSKKLLEETANRGDEDTLNGYDIAKIMVAERIVKLNDILSTEDLRRSEIKSLKIHIDFMGLLSEKLDRPELEVPEEVEKLYETIAKSVDDTSTSPDAISNEKPAEQRPEALPISEADVAYTAFATRIVQAIRKVVRPQPQPSDQPEQISDPEFDYASVGDDNYLARTPAQLVQPPQATELPSAKVTPEQKTVYEAPKKARNKAPLAERLLSRVKKTALSTEALRKEIAHVETAKKLAHIVEKADTLERQAKRARESIVPSLAIAGIARKEIPRRNQQSQVERRSDATSLVDSSPRPQPNNPELQPRPISKNSDENKTPEKLPFGFEIPKNKKIKYMNELELAALSKVVQAGNGRRLYDVYKGGEIDKEGLIKVLESYNKGLDYRRELVNRREKWRRHKLESPEYLNDNQKDTPVADGFYGRDGSNSVDQDAGSAVSPATNKSIGETSSGKFRNIGGASKNRAVIDPNIREMRERVKKQSATLMLAVSVVLILVLFTIVAVINSL